jgi:hypothetical protein
MPRSYQKKIAIDNPPILTLIRQKQSVSYDPFYDGWPAPCAHWRFAYAHGNHERTSGDVCVVEMYASFKKFLYVT